MNKKIETKKKRRVISKETSKEMRHILESVVAKGTGRPAYIDGYRVGGKTGTAQKVGPDGTYMKNNYILSFIGFAPADDPQIVVYVAVDNPKDVVRSEEHTSELQSRGHLVCRLLLEKKNIIN